MTKKLIDRNFGSVMIIVPHQDDEILLSAGIIKSCVDNDIALSIIMATNGDYGCQDYTVGRRRLLETIQGLKVLGVDENALTILGYADTGMPWEESFLYRLFYEKDEKRVFKSFCSDKTYSLEDKCEYHVLKGEKPAPYSREMFKSDIKNIIDDIKPDNIFTTSRFDTHGDHYGLYRFICEALGELDREKDYRPVLFSGIVHSNAGDDHWPDRSLPEYDCPENFERDTALKWEERVSFGVPECMLVKNGKENLKYKALSCYETALEPNAIEFLMSFIKNEEIFWHINLEEGI